MTGARGLVCLVWGCLKIITVSLCKTCVLQVKWPESVAHLTLAAIYDSLVILLAAAHGVCHGCVAY